MDSKKQPFSNQLSPLFDMKKFAGFGDQQASHSKLSRSGRSTLDATKLVIEEQANKGSIVSNKEVAEDLEGTPFFHPVISRSEQNLDNKESLITGQNFKSSTDHNNSDCPRSTNPGQANESPFTFHPENVVKKNNGIILVKPPNEFLQNACDYWKGSCLGYFDKNVIINTDKTTDALVEKYHKVGLSNVYLHQLGYLVLKFDNAQSASKAIQCSPLYIDGQRIHVHRWLEHFHTVYPLNKENVWIEMSNIPFSYWSVNGLCYICSAIGRPVAFHRQTLINAQNKTPSDKALVCVEIDVGASRPTVLMTVIPGHSEKFMAMVNVVYLDSPNICLMCLSNDHPTKVCKDVLELVPFTYDRTRQGKDIFKSEKEYLSDDSSHDSLLVGASKEGGEAKVESSRNHDEGGSEFTLAGDQVHQVKNEASNEEDVEVSEPQDQAKGKLVADDIVKNEGAHSRVVVFGLPAKPFQKQYISKKRKRQVEQEHDKGEEAAAGGPQSHAHGNVDSRGVLLNATQDQGKKRTKCEDQGS